MAIGALAGIGMAASALGGITGAVGGIMAGERAQAAAEYRASVGRRMAEYALEKGNVEAQTQGFKTGKVISAQTAAQGASGLDVRGGSATETRATAAQMGRLDELTILNNAFNKSEGLKTQAELDIMQGETANLEGWLKGAGSILGAASSVSDKWLSYKTRGVF